MPAPIRFLLLPDQRIAYSDTVVVEMTRCFLRVVIWRKLLVFILNKFQGRVFRLRQSVHSRYARQIKTIGYIKLCLTKLMWYWTWEIVYECNTILVCKYICSAEHPYMEPDCSPCPRVRAYASAGGDFQGQLQELQHYAQTHSSSAVVTGNPNVGVSSTCCPLTSRSLALVMYKTQEVVRYRAAHTKTERKAAKLSSLG